MTTIDQNPRPTTQLSHLSWMVVQAVQTATNAFKILRNILTPTPVKPEEELARNRRREATRRAVDKLLR
jgi:hypothetical protein